ncbi:MAG: hypothetical protein KHX03_04465 [Clostridium sp.]|nr:hypothetical protein [Clostridium sp.]
MVSPLSSNVSAIQLLNASNAFKNATRPITPEAQNMPEVSDGIDINDNSILKSQNLDEIKEYAKLAGEENLSDDDIKYGLSYGRSVIVEYMA